MPLPTGRAAGVAGVLALAVLVVPVETGAGWVLALLLAAIAADGWAAPAPWRVEVDRELPEMVVLDGEAELTWRLRNPIRRRLAVALADDLVPSLGANTRRVRVVLPPAGRATARTRLAPSRRGTFRPNTLTVRVAGPLGLGFRQASRALAGRIEVHPSFRSRHAAELRIRRARILEHGSRALRGRGGGTELESLREYVQGDEFRHLDWAATARVGTPIVRTYRPERNQTVMVLLDTGRLMAGLVGGVPRLDHAMDACLALTTVASRVGDRTGLVAFGAGVRALVPPRRGAAQLRELSRALHALEPELVESSYREALAVTLARFRRRALLVLLTELGAEAVEETLLPALGLVARDHGVIVASIRDPAVSGLIDAEVTRPIDAYRSAAAVGVLAERERTTARLHTLGVRVVDAEVEHLPARLGDAYLDVKAAGAL